MLPFSLNPSWYFCHNVKFLNKRFSAKAACQTDKQTMKMNFLDVLQLFLHSTTSDYKIVKKTGRSFLVIVRVQIISFFLKFSFILNKMLLFLFKIFLHCCIQYNLYFKTFCSFGDNMEKRMNEKLRKILDACNYI